MLGPYLVPLILGNFQLGSAEAIPASAWRESLYLGGCSFPEFSAVAERAVLWSAVEGRFEHHGLTIRVSKFFG